MILSYFNKNHFTHTLGLLVYAVILRLPHFLNNRETQMDFTDRIWPSLWDGSAQGVLSQVLALLLSFLAAVMINRLCIRHRLTSEITLHAGLIYLLLLSWTPVGWSLHVLGFVTIFILLLTEQIFGSYKLMVPQGEAFNIGFAASIAVILYPPIFLLWVFCFIGMLIIRNFKWREVLQLILGILAPFILVFTLAFYLDHTEKLVVHLTHIIGWFNTQIWLAQILDLLFLVVPGIFIAFSVLLYTYNVSKKNNQAIKKIDILYWLLLTCGLTLVFGCGVDISLLALTIIPVSLLISLWLARRAGNFLSELVHVLLLLGTIYSQFYIYQ